jgi:hypothetical protein
MKFPDKFYDAIYAMSLDTIKEYISNIQEGVLLVCPHARLMFRTNAKKKIISVVECPAQFVPVEVRQTGTRGAEDGARKEA